MNTLCYYKISRHYKYKLAFDLSYRDDRFEGLNISEPYIEIKDCVLTTKAGYRSDGPSGPTIDTENFMKAAFLHDPIYQLIRLKKLPPAFRKVADEILRDVFLAESMRIYKNKRIMREFSRLRAKWIYGGVRTWFGQQAAKPRPEEDKIICVGG